MKFATEQIWKFATEIIFHCNWDGIEFHHRFQNFATELFSVANLGNLRWNLCFPSQLWRSFLWLTNSIANHFYNGKCFFSNGKIDFFCSVLRSPKSHPSLPTNRQGSSREKHYIRLQKGRTVWRRSSRGNDEKPKEDNVIILLFVMCIGPMGISCM